MISVLNLLIVTLKFQKHNLPFTYNFHMYMVRTMEDEFHGIVGIRYAFLRDEVYQRLFIQLFSEDFIKWYQNGTDECFLMNQQLAALGLRYSMHLHKCSW